MPIGCLTVTGTSRGGTEAQKAWFRSLLRDLRPKTLRHGACVGWDTEAVEIAREVLGDGVKIVAHPGVFHSRPHDLSHRSGRAIEESDEVLPPATMMARNRDMVRLADVVAGAPAFRLEDKEQAATAGGTWYTLQYALTQRKTRYIGYPDGTSE